MDYETARKLFTGRFLLKRRLEANTYLLNPHDKDMNGGPLVVRFFKTDIITFYNDGSFSVKCGGYFRATTQGRFERYLPRGCRMSSETVSSGDKIAALSTPYGTLPWREGMIINSDFQRPDMIGDGYENAWQMRRNVSAYASEYVKELVFKGLPDPEQAGSADCARCIEGEETSPHYRKHIHRGEHPPSLILNAVDTPWYRSVTRKLFQQRRDLWRQPRTKREALRHIEAGLLGFEVGGEDPRSCRRQLRITLERFLLERLGFQIMEPVQNTFIGMYKDDSLNEKMGWA